MPLKIETNIAGETRLKYYSGGRRKRGGDKTKETRHKLLSHVIHQEIILHQQLVGLKLSGKDVLELYDEDSGKLESWSETDFYARKRVLDNLHESHQNVLPKKSRSWGKPHKPTKLTRSARATIYEAGCVLDAYYQGNTYLTTCTLPGSSIALYSLLANESGYIIDRLNKATKKYGCPYYFVWEWQKRGALHLHYALANHDIQKARNAACTIEYEWFELLLELGQKYEVDFFKSSRAPGGSWINNPSKWQSKVELVTKSVARYLSKYLSKGNCDLGVNFCSPSRWWGISKLLRSAVCEHRVSVTIEGVPNLLATLYAEFSSLFGSLDSVSTYPYYFEKKAGQANFSSSNLEFDSINNNSLERDRLLVWGHGLIIHYPSDGWLQKRADIAELLQSELLWSLARETAERLGEPMPYRPREL